MSERTYKCRKQKIVGNNLVVIGDMNEIDGDDNIITGNMNRGRGNRNKISGSMNTWFGDNNISTGGINVLNGTNNQNIIDAEKKFISGVTNLQKIHISEIFANQPIANNLHNSSSDQEEDDEDIRIEEIHGFTYINGVKVEDVRVANIQQVANAAEIINNEQVNNVVQNNNIIELQNNNVREVIINQEVNNVEENDNMREVRKIKVPLDIELKEDIAADEDGKMCYCMENLPNCLIMPCRHKIICVKCSIKLAKDKNVGSVLCPNCRSPIEEIFRIFE